MPLVEGAKCKEHLNVITFGSFLSVLFLVSYIAHHLLAGETKFGDTDHDGLVSIAEQAVVGNLRAFYFILLFTQLCLFMSIHYYSAPLF